MGRSIIYVDEACRQFTQYLKSRGFSYTQGSINAERAEFKVNIGSYNILVWFSAEKQVYGFDMLQGGSKIFSSFTSFVALFETYIRIYTQDIPCAKKIVDLYEKVIGEKAIYNKFSGSSDLGFVILFNIVGNDRQGLRVKATEDDQYTVEYVEYENNNAYVVLRCDKYKVSEDNIVRISKLYLFAEGVDNAEYNEETDELTYKDLVNTLVFKGVGNEIVVTGNSGILYTKGITVDGDNLMELVNNALSSTCWDYIPMGDDISGYLSDNDTLCIGERQYLLTSEGTDLVILDGDKRVKVTSVEELELFIQSKSPIEPIEKVVEENEDTEEKPAEEGTTYVKRLIKDDETSAVRFVRGTHIYDVPVSLVEECGLSIERIVDKTELFTRNGLIITKEELELKTLSIALDYDDTKKAKELVLSLFN